MYRNCSAKLGCKVNATPARKVLKSSLFGPRTNIVHLCVAVSSIRYEIIGKEDTRILRKNG